MSVKPKLALTWWSALLSLPSARTTSMHCCLWISLCFTLNKERSSILALCPSLELSCCGVSARERLEGQGMLGCGRPPCSLLFESGWKRQASRGRPWECPVVLV